VPQSWKLLYKDGSQWRQVIDGNGYATEKDMFNRTAFQSVTTTAVRMEIQMQDNWSGGILELRFEE
jgi:hypothetical protein